MSYPPKTLAPGGAIYDAPLSAIDLQAAKPLSPQGVSRQSAQNSRISIALLAIGVLLLLPMLADIGCGFAPPGKIIVLQNGEFHCLWQVGAKGYRFNVDGRGRIADPSRALCLRERAVLETIAGELNRRLPTEYAECLDRRRDNPLQLRMPALAS